jgi:hypothetical protein
MRSALLLIAALIISPFQCSVSHAEASHEGKTVRLLTVGNSFSQNATHYLAELAKAEGDTLVLHTDDVGGASLELHWKKAQAFEKDPTDKFGQYSGGKGLKEALAGDRWDFVTIQQASILSHDLETYRPFAKDLSDYIHRNAPGATLLLHETWEYRIDDPRFSRSKAAPGQPHTQDEMYQGLSAAYSTIARELGVRELPVGDAFHLANHDAVWGFHVQEKPFDAKNAKPGELPDQTHSLNVGMKWARQADGTTKFSMDGHHASAAGEYLGACVWYEVLFARDVQNDSFVPRELDAEYAKFLRATAHRAVHDAKQ